MNGNREFKDLDIKIVFRSSELETKRLSELYEVILTSLKDFGVSDLVTTEIELKINHIDQRKLRTNTYSLQTP